MEHSKSIGMALIDKFVEALKTKNSSEAISILTMIGIETVLNEMNHNKKFKKNPSTKNFLEEV
jgi:hypothetical protein